MVLPFISYFSGRTQKALLTNVCVCNASFQIAALHVNKAGIWIVFEVWVPWYTALYITNNWSKYPHNDANMHEFVNASRMCPCYLVMFSTMYAEREIGRSCMELWAAEHVRRVSLAVARNCMLSLPYFPPCDTGFTSFFLWSLKHGNNYVWPLRLRWSLERAAYSCAASHLSSKKLIYMQMRLVAAQNVCMCV